VPERGARHKLARQAVREWLGRRVIPESPTKAVVAAGLIGRDPRKPQPGVFPLKGPGNRAFLLDLGRVWNSDLEQPREVRGQ
jgi:hypothetical protein